MKKNNSDDIDAPKPKNIFCFKIKSLEKFPKKKTVSEYTCGLRYVKTNVLNIIYDDEYFFFSMLTLNLSISLLILLHIKCNKKISSNIFSINSMNGVKKF